MRFDSLPQKPQSSCFAKWYSWKAVKNRVAHVQSNSDPAGRAEQLKKKSRGEMRTINSHRGSFLSSFHSLSLSQLRTAKPYTDRKKKKNIAGDTKKSTNYRDRGVLGRRRRGKRWRSPVLQRRFLSNLICCISYFWSAASCIKSYIFTSRVKIPQGSLTEPSLSHVKYSEPWDLAWI